MATLITNACDGIETVGVIQSRVEVMIGEARETFAKRKPFRMRWICDTDIEGRSIMRMHWGEGAGCCARMSKVTSTVSTR
jgi:hypothetical protein